MNKSFFRACFILMMYLPCLLFARHLEKPGIPVVKSSFTVFADAGTYKQCKKEIEAYKQMLEEKIFQLLLSMGLWKIPTIVETIDRLN